jgi:hypothetical protein
MNLAETTSFTLSARQLLPDEGPEIVSFLTDWINRIVPSQYRYLVSFSKEPSSIKGAVEHHAKIEGPNAIIINVMRKYYGKYIPECYKKMLDE